MANTPGWMILTHWISRLILLGLGALSIWSLGIIFDRVRYFRTLRNRTGTQKGQELLSAGDLTQFAQWIQQEAQSPHAPVARSLLPAVQMSLQEVDALDRAVRSAFADQKLALESGTTVLATLGSNAPFIGLFGTVLGIIEAFGQLSLMQSGQSGQSGTQGVVGGISEALVATAMGLFVAIPAVVAYNLLSKWTRDVQTEVEKLRDLYASRLLTQKRGRT